MTLLRPAGLAAPWVCVMACAVGSGAPADDAASAPAPSAQATDGADSGTADGRVGPALPAAPAERPDASSVASDEAGGVALPDASPDSSASDAGAILDAPAAPPPRDAAPLGPSGLLYYYPFDGDVSDASGHGNDAVAHALQFVADRAGAPGRAAHFDGATTWVSAPGTLLPLAARERTVTAWVKAASSPPAGLYGNALVSWGSGDCVGQMWGLGDISDAVLVWTGCNDQQTHSALPRDTWTFVAVRFTAPTTARVWTGTSSVDVTLPLAPNTAASLLWIGAETTTNDSAAIRRYFAGDIDSVRVYGRALGDSEVADVYALP